VRVVLPRQEGGIFRGFGFVEFTANKSGEMVIFLIFFIKYFLFSLLKGP
jgi:hypothetical protein